MLWDSGLSTDLRQRPKTLISVDEASCTGGLWFITAMGKKGPLPTIPSPQQHLIEILLSRVKGIYFIFFLRQGLTMLPSPDLTHRVQWTFWDGNWLGTRVSGECRILFVRSSCYCTFVPTLPWSAGQEPVSCYFREYHFPPIYQSWCPGLAAYCLGWGQSSFSSLCLPHSFIHAACLYLEWPLVLF